MEYIHHRNTYNKKCRTVFILIRTRRLHKIISRYIDQSKSKSESGRTKSFNKANKSYKLNPNPCLSSIFSAVLSAYQIILGNIKFCINLMPTRFQLFH